jgi:hypothetical protein
MADLRRTPSVQHAVALIKPTVADTLLEMQKLDAACIPFSLNPGRRMFKPLMEGYPLVWVTDQLKLDRKPKNIQPNIGLVTAFEPYAKDKKVPWFRECEMHTYPIGSGVVIPVRPAGFWAEDGRLRVLWPQCWKGRTLDPLQRALFNTILRQTFFVGDFKNAALEFVDLREQVPRKGRDIEIIAGDDLGLVTAAELADYLQILLTAFEQHSTIKAARKAEEAAKRAKSPKDAPLFEDLLEPEKR